jgi:hypothetical protein
MSLATEVKLRVQRSLKTLCVTSPGGRVSDHILLRPPASILCVFERRESNATILVDVGSVTRKTLHALSKSSHFPLADDVPTADHAPNPIS